jgi:hypothetical protein
MSKVYFGVSIFMYDGINALAAGIARQFPNAALVAGYLNGSYAWSQGQWNLFPDANHVTISVTAGANEGDVLDVESGDATPDQAAGWIAMRKAAGLYRPTIYCSRSVIPAVRVGTGSYILDKDYDIWVADYTGVAHQVTGCAATQYESTANYDVSIVYDTAWPHRKAPAPTSPPGPVPLPAPSGLSATLHGQIADFGWGPLEGSKSYIFQLFHHNAQGVYGDAVANETVTDNHVEQFRLPGGGQYAVRVRSHDPVGDWTDWKIF